MRILLILGLLGVWLGGLQAQTVIKTGLAQHDVYPAIPTQIESPAEAGDGDVIADGLDDDDEDGDDDTGFDINYVVDRPTSEPDEEIKCDDLGDIAEEGELHCVDESKPRAPWKKTKKYKTSWKRRPLLMI